MDSLPYVFPPSNGLVVYPDLDCLREAARPDRVAELDLLDIGVPVDLLPQAKHLAARLDLCHAGAYSAMEVLFCEIVDEPLSVMIEGTTVLPVPALEAEVRQFAALVAASRKAVA